MLVDTIERDRTVVNAAALVPVVIIINRMPAAFKCPSRGAEGGEQPIAYGNMQ